MRREQQQSLLPLTFNTPSHMGPEGWHTNGLGQGQPLAKGAGGRVGTECPGDPGALLMSCQGEGEGAAGPPAAPLRGRGTGRLPGSRAGRTPGGGGRRPPLQPSAPSWISGRSFQTLTTAGQSAAAGQPGRGEEGVTDTPPAQEGSLRHVRHPNPSRAHTPQPAGCLQTQNHPISHTWLNSPRESRAQRPQRPQVPSRDTRGLPATPSPGRAVQG